MIAFEFDRAKMRQKFALYTSILVGGMILFATLSSLTASYFGEHTLAQWIALAMAFVISGGFLDYALWVGILGRSLRRQGAAIVVNHSGIIDNASDYTLGQIAWSEIEKIYPQDWTTWLFGPRWQKLPIISRHRVIMVILKDDADLQARLQSKSWVRRWSFQNLSKRGQKRWLFIPEVLIATPADELMQRLNEFYKTQVIV